MQARAKTQWGPKGGGPKGGGPKGGGPKGGAPEGRGAKVGLAKVGLAKVGHDRFSSDEDEDNVENSMFCSFAHHAHMWEEGGEQGDPMMPLLCFVPALRSGGHSEEFREDEVVCTFFCQTHIASAPFTQRCSSTCTRTFASGSTVTQVWNRAGIRPSGCEAMERIAQLSDNDARG